MTSNVELLAKCHGLPLCRWYGIVQFVVQPSTVRAGGDVHRWPVTWARGTLNDGQGGLLGAWQHATDGAPNWPAIFDDLALRGVERVRIAIDTDAAAAIAAFPRATLLQRALRGSDSRLGSTRQDATGSMNHVASNARCCDASQLPRRVRQMVRRSEEAARALQRGLTQAITRHGLFDSPREAATFVESWLEDAERRGRQRRHAAQRRSELAAASLAP